MARYSEFLQSWEPKIEIAKQKGDKKMLKAYDRLCRLVENISERDFVEFLQGAVRQRVSSGRVYIVTQKDENGRVKHYELTDDLSKPVTKLAFSLPEYEKQNISIRERIAGIQWDMRKSKDKLLAKQDFQKTWEKFLYQQQDEICSKRYTDLDGSGKLPTWKTYLRANEEEAD